MFSQFLRDKLLTSSAATHALYRLPTSNVPITLGQKIKSFQLEVETREVLTYVPMHGAIEPPSKQRSSCTAIEYNHEKISIILSWSKTLK